jgi:hypothetical protein
MYSIIFNCNFALDTLQLRKSARPRPILKFYDINRILRPIDEDEAAEGLNDAESDESDDDADGEWASKAKCQEPEPMAPTDLDYELSSVLPMQDDDDINMSSPDLEDMLADSPVPLPVVFNDPKGSVSVMINPEEGGGVFELGEWV